jgi:hypothetical protein
VVGLVGLAALATGATMFLDPPLMVAIWPWSLTPLTCRVVGAIFCLGAAGVGAFVDARWISIRMMVQVEALMIALMLVAVLRAPGEFATARPLTWLMLVGFVAVLLGSGYLWYSHEVAPRRHSRQGTPDRTSGSAG